MSWFLLVWHCTVSGVCAFNPHPVSYETALECRQAQQHYLAHDAAAEIWTDTRCEPLTER